MDKDALRWAVPSAMAKSVAIFAGKTTVKKILALAALLTTSVMSSVPAQAQNLTVGNMVGLCVRGNVTQGVTDASCIAWFEGFTTAVRLTGRPAGLAARDSACLPASLTVDQSVLALLQYVQGDQTTVAQPAGVGAYRALARTYPCTK